MIVPLRKLTKDGTPYTRDDDVARAIDTLSKLPVSEVLELARNPDEKSPDFIRSECLLYFIRNLTFSEDKHSFADLFVILRERVLRAVPVYAKRRAGKHADRASDLEIRDLVLQKFNEMLCSDREDYETRLDFYELKFNSALSKLCIDAFRKVRRTLPGNQQLTMTAYSNDISAEIEAAFERMKKTSDSESLENRYRLRLPAAISTLPDDERRVVELIQSGLPIESQDEDVLSIVKVLGCVEKTVRNRRDRAYKKLYDALKEEEEA